MKKFLKQTTCKVILLFLLLSLSFSCVRANTPPTKINVYLAGDSTVKTYGSSRGEGGWGEYLPNYFQENVAIINKSEGGRSSRSFINESRLKDILDVIKPGDYLFIQFGHNDCANDASNLLERYAPVGQPDPTGVYPVTPGNPVPTPAELKASKPLHGATYYAHDSGGTYKWFLKQFVDGAKAKGAIPVLVTPVSRMYFNGAVIREHHDDSTSHGNAYVVAMKQLAAEEKVLCIDMFGVTKAMYERMGEKEASRMQFVKKDGNLDKTHYNKYGGFYVGGLMADEIKKANISISPFVQAPSQVITLDSIKK
ncbi:MAG TPA: rhamnogalacturonan acetylesterase [Bacillota bacterium]|nr:rhamnogalacturonan acetylesterase [Bacillota bacterium]